MSASCLIPSSSSCCAAASLCRTHRTNTLKGKLTSRCSSVHFLRPKELSSLSVTTLPTSKFLSFYNNNDNKTSRFHPRLALLALMQEDQFLAKATESSDSEDEKSAASESSQNSEKVPSELYVCNLPRSCDISELLELFKPYGTVLSIEVSRNAETGISRGCGYVTLSSFDEASAAIAALDGSDISGREMRVRFSVEMNSGSKVLSLRPKKNLIFESPYKIYVGNLAWSVKPGDLRNLFSQFGTVVSSRVLHDRKSGKDRVYGFLSFSSAAERKSALSLNGTDFCGRMLLVREVLKKE